MTLNYYRLTPPSKYQRHVDYKIYNIYHYRLLYYHRPRLQSFSPTNILRVFFFPVLFYLLYRFVASYGSMRTRFHPTTNDCSSYRTGLPRRRHMIIITVAHTETIFGISVSAIGRRRRGGTAAVEKTILYYYYYYCCCYYYYYTHWPAGEV